MNTSDKKLLLECEMKAQSFRVLRHLPGGEAKAKATHYGNEIILSTEEGRKELINAVQNCKPYMAARFGTNEGRALYEYWKRKLEFTKKAYPKIVRKELTECAGFFPNEMGAINKWCEAETEACKDLDMLGVMNYLGEEWIYRVFCNQAKLMPCGGLASASKGWAWALEDKKVLVIHPFTDTIQSQYKNHREEIFPGTNALPKFDLKCVKAVQTIADATDDRFETWFDALDYMTDEAAKQDFDVALIGCGAYGFQLASRIKQMGKTAIHMGGSLQTLFGIKGGRWDVKYSNMYNNSWVYPSENEKPAGFEKVEGGCYWGK